MAADQFSALMELLVFTWLDGFAVLTLLCFVAGFLGWYVAAFFRFFLLPPLDRLLSRLVRRVVRRWLLEPGRPGL